MSNFSGLLNTYRRRAGKSINAAAKEAGISPTYWSRIEKDERIPPRRHIVERMATVLELSARESESLLAAAGYFPWDISDRDGIVLVTEVAHMAVNRRLDPMQRADYIRILTSILNNWYAYGGSDE